MKRAFIAVMLACALALAACGGHATVPTHGATSPTPAPHLARFCSGLTDICYTLKPTAALTLQSARGRIPDVSSFQGHPNWAQAKAAGIAGGIFKGGEFQVDPTAAFNNAELRRLHIWHAMYWFVRNTGCSHEAGQIIGLARFLQVSVVVNDLEVPEARGYGACLVPRERAAHLIPVDYTAPGTWPGGPGFGEAPLWQAEYGPTLHPFWHPVLAWQCTDGRVGCVTVVPGIGVDDVSVNLGITKLGSKPRPKPEPKRVCYSHRITAKQCAAAKARVAKLREEKRIDAWRLWWAKSHLERRHCRTHHSHACARLERKRSAMAYNVRWLGSHIRETIKNH